MVKKVLIAIASIAILLGIWGLTRKGEPTKTARKKYSCKKKVSCSQIKTCARAKYLLKECGFEELDRDGDGIPCEGICKDK